MVLKIDTIYHAGIVITAQVKLKNKIDSRFCSILSTRRFTSVVVAAMMCLVLTMLQHMGIELNDRCEYIPTYVARSG